MSILVEHGEAFQREAIARHIQRPCPRCGDGRFDLQGYSFKRYSETPGDFNLVGPVFPTILAVCVNCGFVAEHAAHTLGIDVSAQTRIEK